MNGSTLPASPTGSTPRSLSRKLVRWLRPSKDLSNRGLTEEEERASRTPKTPDDFPVSWPNPTPHYFAANPWIGTSAGLVPSGEVDTLTTAQLGPITEANLTDRIARRATTSQGNGKTEGDESANANNGLNDIETLNRIRGTFGSLTERSIYNGLLATASEESVEIIPPGIPQKHHKPTGLVDTVRSATGNNESKPHPVVAQNTSVTDTDRTDDELNEALLLTRRALSDLPPDDAQPTNRPSKVQGTQRVVMPWIEYTIALGGETGHYRQLAATPTAYGGFSDIYQSEARLPDGSIIVVAVKRLRAVKLRKTLEEWNIDEKLQKRLNREVKIWINLRHRNICPLLGFGLSKEVCIISPWFENGNVAAYLETNPSADRMLLIRQIVEGVLYLHERNPVVVHGDLKPDNVLIDQDGVPKLIDFGLSKAIEAEQGTASISSTSLRDAGNARWIAPELLFEEGLSRSCSTDVFSLGCVVFFILTGDIPFKGKSDRTLYLARHTGAQPMENSAEYQVLETRPNLLGALLDCWNADPIARPKLSGLVGRL